MSLINYEKIINNAKSFDEFVIVLHFEGDTSILYIACNILFNLKNIICHQKYIALN